MENSSQKLKEIINSLKQLKRDKNYDALITESKKALAIYNDNRRIKHFLHFGQAHYISQKLNSDLVRQLEEEENFQTLTQVYYKLLSVFPESKKLKKLLLVVEKKMKERDESESKEYSKDAQNIVWKLLNEKKYDAALQACYQLLIYQPDNVKFQKLMKKTRMLRNREIALDLEKYFDESNPTLKAEFLVNKKAFVRI